jgi:IclR family transcriptional regulator, pca regulon regulatory protein
LRVTDPGVSVLNATVLRERARPELEELSRVVSYTVSLAVLDAPEIVLVDRVRSRLGRKDVFGRGLHTGSRLPAYCTAMGKVLLACSGLGLAELLHGVSLKRWGPHTITSRRGLRPELERAWKEGLAVCDEEFVRGRCAIAVPVRDVTGEVIAAIGIAAEVPAVSTQELIDGLSPHLRFTAARISARLGLGPAPE